MAFLRRRGHLALFLLVALLGLALVAAACGDDDDDDDDDDGTATVEVTETEEAGGATNATVTETATEEAETPSAETPSDGATETTFEVIMGDNFFEPNEFTVPAGEEITFELVNEGDAIHNMAVEVGGENFVSEPDSIRGGEEGTLTVTFDEPGEYDFLCEFHPTEMTGTITVE
ncbi:MAG TPA: cupredoxin domain-containing protein [Dehalococcoidia bacterium]|nr:cupredoxin domain-containing protein [Dehalococcoidia bacterium]